MAPVFGIFAVAGGLFRFVLIILCALLLLSSSSYDVSAVWMYDRQTMILIRSSVTKCGGFCTWSGLDESTLYRCPPALAVCMREGEGLERRTKKRRRRRGKRAGRQVYLRKLWKLEQCCVVSRLPCLRPLVPSVYSGPFLLPLRVSSTGRGVCDEHLRPLLRTSVSVSGGRSAPLKIALLNVRSIRNKSFLLNELFTYKNLDFMLLMETWQRSMEFSHLIELCPAECSFISTPRLVGRGGGLAVVYKNQFICQLMNSNTYSSFELQMSKVGQSNSFYCILVYWPPGILGPFLSDFTDFFILYH